MKWQGRRRSSNVEDRRSSGGGGLAFGGGGIGLIIIIVLSLLGGGNIGDILGNITGGDTGGQVPYEETSRDKELAEFVSVVLADTEDVWKEVFRKNGLEYREPTLVLFSGSVQSACGVAGSATGPFYCPPDEKLYIDLSFYDDLNRKYGAPGDFAMAYVVAHEVGHHVQNLLGISEKVQALRPKLSEKEYNKYSVKLELQADYLAGVWAHYQEDMGLLEEGDLQEALDAASAVGDDRLQKQATGRVAPDSFTHGTSKQRMEWFYKGYNLGTLEGGDTFNDRNFR
ncbi:KPN_02809 family neutral zinc metallopeptidase [Tissierella creatinophila]|uniref:Putative neutral zinc metallopeptidase n=1 Tax=Tissierella creatinophila DSM 6911 TaxID=1123403 RepID=A0A1U7M8I1_TISCR|nr:neutral zinc metallopeptidase [Tissierella creatinophila]OLS03644.1 putative neutral zinc metallopeptidase [Tissierella creatinophila DSM 6911]